jgi:hypothetical protein
MQHPTSCGVGQVFEFRVQVWIGVVGHLSAGHINTHAVIITCRCIGVTSLFQLPQF